MTDVQLVETSLRDGNQCLWAALGVDTARTLTIAPVMDRVGFKAIDFTTSTHMGVAVRYKHEDPWERIRLMAAATPNTPLQFMSTGFRFISWETASPELMALAFRVLARNGIRRFCLADPMNDADSNIACARMVKHGGGEYVIAALVFTLSPIHDDAHYAERARRLSASADIDALYIKDPGGLLSPSRARTLIPAIKAVIGAKPDAPTWRTSVCRSRASSWSCDGTHAGPRRGHRRERRGCPTGRRRAAATHQRVPIAAILTSTATARWPPPWPHSPHRCREGGPPCESRP
jgi:oxaloacetate decarboxylase (Na+ extruding) subunit alpha